MSKLSLIFPSRDERFLIPSIHDAMKNARGEFEVIAVLDSDRWPEGWKEITDRYPNLHTIHHGQPKGLRAAINSGAASAKSRGAKYVAKFDAHCAFGEGFDEVLKSDMDHDWVVIPRRKRLDADNWTITDTHKIDIDYHYLSFPDDPADFGGKGLNGKPWDERSRERRDKPEYEIDDEMASQGSGWAMHTDYFYKLELMDEANYGPFWNESQELLLKCWLSGGRGVVNKKTWYAHLHKGKTHGRGYKLPEKWLQQGATYTKLWMFNEAWPKQTLPFKWLIDHFWPVPTWPENWEEVLYATRKPRGIIAPFRKLKDSDMVLVTPDSGGMELHVHPGSLQIHSAFYGIGSGETESIDVTERVRSLVKNGVLDITVSNATLSPFTNPFRGKKKTLRLKYSFDGNEPVTVEREEKDWLIIGPAVRDGVNSLVAQSSDKYNLPQPIPDIEDLEPSWLPQSLMTPAALNDYLIRKFSVSPQRLRGPMPIELRDFHRNDLAQLFAELGFRRGGEIGVAEGNYSEVLLKANPECELLLVDPWHHYSDNPQGKSKEKHEFAYNETIRKTKNYPNVTILEAFSMDAVRSVEDGSLDFVYIDAHHSYPYVMCDIIEWAKKVRSGGIVAGDDVYTLNEKWGAGPMEAIYDYTRAMRINPWWLIAARKSVDFFFVKS